MKPRDIIKILEKWPSNDHIKLMEFNEEALLKIVIKMPKNK